MTQLQPSIRILHLEDDPRDAELVHAQLREAGLVFDALVIDNEASLRQAIGGRTFDVIISDNTLVGFDGITALRIVRELDLVTPFIFVSGTIGEEKAIEAMRTGAADYVLKHRLEKLPLTVQRVLRESRDTAERARMEAELRERERLFTQLTQAIREVFWVASPGHERVLYASPAYEEIWGQPVQTLYRQPSSKYDVVHREDADAVRELLGGAAAAAGVSVRYRIQRRDGTRWILERAWPSLDDEGRVANLVGVARDITDQVQLEEQLLQSRKLEAVGRLAGGIAHDFNNILSVIIGHSELLLDECGSDGSHIEGLGTIRRAAQRAAALTRQLLAFSRQQVLQPRVLNLNASVSDVNRMLQRVIGEHIELTTELAADLGRVRADPGQIEQVLMNLMVNARDAMPGGGRVTIRTGNVEVRPEQAAAHPGIAPGRYVVLVVEDTGTGMTPEVRDRIFEPFFTTKGTEKGTGLGLSTVLGIVEQSGGFIEVDTAPGRGTTFRIYLARVDEPVQPAVAAPQPGELTGRTETVLLVEDEVDVRTLTGTLLRRAGYTVLEAADAASALQIAQTHAGPIHVLVSDVVLPGETGVSIARRLARERPDIRVLLMSGYTRGGVGEVSDTGGLPVLEKPFSPKQLMQRLAAVLDAPRT